jgi:hypothetical protein
MVSADRMMDAGLAGWHLEREQVRAGLGVVLSQGFCQPGPSKIKATPAIGPPLPRTALLKYRKIKSSSPGPPEGVVICSDLRSYKCFRIWRREWDCVPTNFRNHSNNGEIVLSLCNRRCFLDRYHEVRRWLTKLTAAKTRRIIRQKSNKIVTRIQKLSRFRHAR